MYIEKDQESGLYLQQDSVENQKKELYLEKDLEKDSGSDWNLEISLGLGLGIAVVVVGYFLYKKATAPKTKTEGGIDEGAKHSIDSFINDIILDYYNEYRINFLAVRYNIKELESKISYVLKTKRIGSLSNIVDFSHVSSGEEYLEEFIKRRYNIDVSAEERLPFITEVSRIEGKIEAVESAKALLPEEDYKKLMGKLEENVIFYKKKYAAIDPEM